MTHKYNKIVVLSGFSASGKDSVAERLKKNGYNFVVSTTTRPMRRYESEGEPYWFTTEEEFLKLDLIEHRKYNTLVDGIPDVWHYGVTTDAIEDDKPYVVVLDILGLREFKEHFGDRVIPFFLEADEPTRRSRCINRSDFNLEEWTRRYEDDKTQFTDEVIAKECDYIIPSYELEHTVTTIELILEKKYGKI